MLTPNSPLAPWYEELKWKALSSICTYWMKQLKAKYLGFSDFYTLGPEGGGGERPDLLETGLHLKRKEPENLTHS